MLFDDPSSSSPSDGDARRVALERYASATDPTVPDPRSSGPAARPAAPDPRPSPPDPRLIESAGAPAPEALSATTIAAAVARDLYETGREVRFAFVPTRDRVTVLLCDMDGAVLSRLTPARALEIATGEPVPGGRRR